MKDRASVREGADGYDALSPVYAEMWGRNYAPLFIDVVDREVLQYLERGSSLLDLGCGTGQLAAHAAAAGHRVTGLDLSEDMVAAARRRVPGGRFVVGDIADFSFEDRFDAIVSTLDCFNHCMTPERLLQAFVAAREHLAPDGVFFFDMNGRQAFVPSWSRTMDLLDRGRFLAIDCALDDSDGIATYRIVLFTRDGTNWQRGDIRVQQRCYEPDAVLALLAEAGLRGSAHNAADDLGIPGLPGRTFYFAQRND